MSETTYETKIQILVNIIMQMEVILEFPKMVMKLSESQKTMLLARVGASLSSVIFEEREPKKVMTDFEKERDKLMKHIKDTRLTNNILDKIDIDKAIKDLKKDVGLT